MDLSTDTKPRIEELGSPEVIVLNRPDAQDVKLSPRPSVGRRNQLKSKSPRKLHIRIFRLKVETRQTGPISRWLLVKFAEDGFQWISIEKMMSIAPEYTKEFVKSEYERIIRNAPF